MVLEWGEVVGVHVQSSAFSCLLLCLQVTPVGKRLCNVWALGQPEYLFRGVNHLQLWCTKSLGPYASQEVPLHFPHGHGLSFAIAGIWWVLIRSSGDLWELGLACQGNEILHVSYARSLWSLVDQAQFVFDSLINAWDKRTLRGFNHTEGAFMVWTCLSMKPFNWGK